MKFLNPIFLFFLPVAFLPLIFYLIEKIKRKRIVFSSIELIEEVLKEEKNKFRINFFIKQLLKSFIILFVIFGFSKPVFLKRVNFEGFTAIIDPTLSMSVFNMPEIVYFLKFRGVEKIYFGIDEIASDFKFERDVDIVSLINSIKASKILLVTDGQKSNFVNLKFLDKNVTVILLSHKSKNYYFKEFELFPQILTTGSEFFLNLTIEADRNVDIFVYLNDKLIYEEKSKSIRKNFYPDRELLLTKNKLKIRFEAGDPAFDNEIERDFYFLPSINLYLGITDLSTKQYIRKTFRAIFGEVKEIFDYNSADIVFTTDFIPNLEKPLFIIPDNFQYKDLKFIKKDNVFGKIYCNFLPDIHNVKLENIYELVGNVYDFKPFVKIMEFPIIYKNNHSYLFSFSLKENLNEMSKNPFLPIFFYESVKDFFVKDEKYIVSKESIFDFYSKSDFKSAFDYEEIKKGYFELSIVLIVFALIIFLIDLFF